ncbi:MAG: transglycosylase domain-containing protein [Treponema sp.]|nr:transglycosylase domain-containing protein [Treponema sp.]
MAMFTSLRVESVVIDLYFFMKKSFKKILIALSAVAAFFLTVHLVLRFIPYPELKELQNQPYSTRIYDRNGKLVQVTVLQDGLRREFTSIREIPPQIKKIFIKAEDKRFYFHCGVDFVAAAKAFVQNAGAKKTVRGASTITMQLAKIISPLQEHSLGKKFADAVNALKIEARLSKNQILELYLNSLPFGLNSEGITSAARTFYGLELSALSDEQICCLATIPRHPNFYNPIKNPEECAEKAFLIAKKINRKISYDEVLSAAKMARQFQYPFNFPHYVYYLQKNDYAGTTQFYVSQKNAVSTSSAAKNEFSGNTNTAPKSAPYQVHLAADLDLQNAAQNYVMQALEMTQNSRISNAALLLIDNSNGSVLSWIGNGDWFDTEHNGQIDGVLVKNQPGSSMKPFLYALALEQKDADGNNLYYPSKILADIPSEFGREKLYIPSNFNNRFNGPIRFRIALASSLNIPAVSILNDVGVDNYLNKLYELGFESLRAKGKTADLGLALGAAEVTLQELVNAFSIFARDGVDFTGNQIYSNDTARLICSILSDKGARALGFGYSQTFQTDYPSIFKTGTSNQYQDIVALGSTKNYTIGVWMGNFSGQTVMGKTGSSLPAWIAKNVLDILEKGGNRSDIGTKWAGDEKNVSHNAAGTKSAAADWSPREFLVPEHWHKQKICSLSGMPAGPDCPACVYEYVPDSWNKAQPNNLAAPDNNAATTNDSTATTNNSTCTWHKNVNSNVQIVYPAEYQQWARQYNINGNINYSTAPLALVTPNNYSVFYYSSLDSSRQAIPVELSGGYSDELTVTYDGRFYKQIGRPFVFNLPVQKGSHTCTVECGFESLSFEFIVK